LAHPSLSFPVPLSRKWIWSRVSSLAWVPVCLCHYATVRHDKEY
jgi:hypothetical protein